MEWLSLFDPLVDAFNSWRERRHELKMAKHEGKLTKIEAQAEIEKARAQGAIQRLAERQRADIDWELMSIKNSGWKDEYLTVLITASLVLVFLPWTQPYVIDGFRALEATPFWYQMAILIVIGSAFGVRVFDNFKRVLAKGKSNA
jgi:hypothetical protein